jgi:hypothetical protein
LLSLTQGQADPAQFSSEAQMTPREAKETGEFYRALGPLKSFRLIDRRTDKGRRIYRYQAGFGTSRWVQSFILTPEDKVAAVVLEPNGG